MADHITLTLPAKLEALEQLTPYIESVTGTASHRLRTQLTLAVHELCVNIIRHGYAGEWGEIVLDAECFTQGLRLSIYDTAPNPYQNNERPAPQPLDLPESGWGSIILRRVMDKVSYTRYPTGDVWDLVKFWNEESLVTLPVLVVDDESVIRRLVGFALKPLQIEVLTADSATSAVEIAQRQAVSLLLIDINLPDMDGFTLIQELRKIPHMVNVPIISFTARNDVEDEAHARKSGAVGLLYKPFSMQELRDIVKKFAVH